jgi:uncharacterized protein YbjQ (UPF0145 family)
MNDVPGHTVTSVLGEVSGLAVRSRNVGVQIGAALKSLVGGELQGITLQLAQTRQQAVERLIENAEAMGANAILAMRFDSNDIAGMYQEILAYGTACVIDPA